ncbi:MAG: DSD1 family PLP-dependent enzyme [Nitrososphaerales archaeon]
MQISEIDTPALLIDLDVMERNIAKMARFCRETGCNLRPHIKVHRTPAIAHKQIQAGAIGLTCAKVSEAEVMVASGIGDVLIANQIVGPTKVSRLAGMARHARVAAAFDDAANAEEVSREALRQGSRVGAVIEVDLGMNRAGVQPGMPALALARRIRDLPGLEFRGVMGYEGHLQKVERVGERTEAVGRCLAQLASTARLLKEEGMECEIVSAGGTNSYAGTARAEGVTEIQAGSYVFMDVMHDIEGVDFEHSFTVLSTVTSRPARERAIIDAGVKCFSEMKTMPRSTAPGIEVTALSEEHGSLALREGVDPRIGDTLSFYPYYAPTTVNLFDRFYCGRKDRVEIQWEILARGKSQ